MTYENLTVERCKAATILTLNRPQRRNALSLALMRELIAALEACGREEQPRLPLPPRAEAAAPMSGLNGDIPFSGEQVRVVILAAAGNVFSSGHDLSEMTGRAMADYREIFDVCTQLMTTVQAIPQPVIAEVQGLATAAGCQLVATCDLAIASDEASFATPGVKIGLFCTTPMVALTRAVGRKRAFEMLVTGDPIDARTAAEWGLINRVVPAAKLRSSTLELAGKVSEVSSLTVSLGKSAFYSQIDLDQPKAYAYAKEVMSMNALANDAQEGITAFLQKRPACWTGS
jgi:enoyl-CoA hydratase/carnithine racemase